MAVYEYECEAGHTFEVEQRITDEPLTECTHDNDLAPGWLCRKPCRRLISRTSFTLKGKGWARDGYGG